MTDVFGEMLPSSGVDGYKKTFETNRWLRAEVLTPLISIEEVLATQALVMQLLARQNRSVLHRDKRHGFAALNNTQTNQNELYDGSTEEYLSVRVAKITYDQWKMRVRFRQNDIDETKKAISYIDDFSFDWLKNGNLQAWYGNIKSQPDPKGGSMENWIDIRPIDQDTVTTLHERIKDHMDIVIEATNPSSR